MFRQLRRQTVRTLPRTPIVHSRSVHNTLVPHPGPNNNGEQKRKRDPKRTTSYSGMTAAQANKRQGFRIPLLRAIPVERMLTKGRGEDINSPLNSKETKEEVYKELVRYIQIEGYPTECDPEFKEANINHLVYATISPILSDFISMTGRKTLQLGSEKEILSKGGETGGTEEFVVVDLISVEEENFVLIIEAKRSSVGRAMRQCFLAMKDMRDHNGRGDVYGFVTTGESWQMLKYDGTSFQLSGKMEVLFPWMDEDKEKWMKDYSAVVDCIKFALSNGGLKG